MRILTTDEVRHAEQEAVNRLGISTQVMMERAGAAVARFCVSHFKVDSVCVVCGKGNNGGDGMVAAEALLPVVKELSVIVLAQNANQLSEAAKMMCSRLSSPPIWVADAAGFDSEAVRHALAADLIIDAIVGTGFKAPLRGLSQHAVKAINESSATVVAVDLPSGVEADITEPVAQDHDNMVSADGIVTFIAPKPAHVFGDLTTGPIAVSEIGVPPVPNMTGLQVTTGREVELIFPPRARDSHKGTFGHVLVVAGSEGKAGAAGLAGLAALRTSAGLVTVACPRSIQATVAGFAPELMTEGLEETSQGSIALQAMSRLEQLVEGKNALVIGPGLSQHPETSECVRRLVKNARQPLVLDADGLNAFDGRYKELKFSGDIFRALTPHPGEAARLLQVSTKDIQSARIETAQRMAKETGACVVLKGSHTIVGGASGVTWLNMSGNPAMGKGGAGDVLSGITGAALAGLEGRMKTSSAHGYELRRSQTRQEICSPGNEKLRKLQPQERQSHDTQHTLQIASGLLASGFTKDLAVAAAVHLHGLGGDFARDSLHENTVLASDITAHLHEAFHDCEQQLEQDLFYLQT